MAEDGKITVLFVNPSNGLSGDTQSLAFLIESLKQKVLPIVLLTEEGDAYRLFKSHGIECLIHPYQNVLALPFLDYLKNVVLHPWRFRFVKWFRYDLPCLRYVKRVLAGRKVDIVHTNTAPTYMGARIAKMYNVPHVWHVREYLDDTHCIGRIFFGRRWLRKQINEASARIVVSSPCRDFWQFKDDGTYTINDAVLNKDDCCYEEPKQSYLLFCSYWVTEGKGVFSAVRAYGKSGLFRDGIRLKVVGNTSSETVLKIKALTEEYNCTGMVDCIPVQKDVKPLFAKAMAYINPSINEGMGRTTGEAMFYGCPVVARASGGTLDLIKSGETGWLFTTEEECASLLKMVCSTDQKDIILNAQKFACEHLSTGNYGNRIMDVYNKMLSNKLQLEKALRRAKDKKVCE